MNNIEQNVANDQLLQYLAMYHATKGMMIPAEVTTIHKYFVDFKMHVKAGEYSIPWLCETIVGKYGTLQMTNPHPKMTAVPPEVVSILQNKEVKKEEHMQSGNVATDIDPAEQFADLMIMNDMCDKIKGLCQKYQIESPFKIEVKKPRKSSKKPEPGQ